MLLVIDEGLHLAWLYFEGLLLLFFLSQFILKGLYKALITTVVLLKVTKLFYDQVIVIDHNIFLASLFIQVTPYLLHLAKEVGCLFQSFCKAVILRYDFHKHVMFVFRVIILVLQRVLNDVMNFILFIKIFC